MYPKFMIFKVCHDSVCPTRPALKEGSLGVARRTSDTGEEEPATLILAINAWRNKGYSACMEFDQ